MHLKLRDTPLIVNPNTLLGQRPNPISLPYDLKELPQSTNNLIEQINNNELPILNNIISKSNELLKNDNIDKNIDSSYKEWELEIQRLNPGFTAVKDVMSPTKKL